MGSNIIIPDEKSLEEKKQRITAGGLSRLHIVSDFDKTLTNMFVEGDEVPSVISVLRDRNYLSQDYREKAKALALKYMAIERDPDVPIDEKKKAMLSWWTKHFDLLIRSGLSKKDLERVVKSRRIQLRKGVSGLLSYLNRNDVPLVIISSSGLGEAIPMYLERFDLMYPNIHLVTNSYVWGKDNRAVDIRRPIIHSMNKDETSIRELPFYPKIMQRKNVILLGNSLGDLGMIAGFSYDSLIKIGFFSEKFDDSGKYKRNLEEFRKNYDVVILNDGDMGYVNGLVRKVR